MKNSHLYTYDNIPGGLTVKTMIELGFQRIALGDSELKSICLYHLEDVINSGSSFGWNGPGNDPAGRLAYAPIHEWLCTDTFVGWNMYLYSGKVYMLSFQSARRNDLHKYIVDLELFREAEVYRKSLSTEEEELPGKVVSMDTKLTDDNGRDDTQQHIRVRYDSRLTTTADGHSHRVEMSINEYGVPSEICAKFERAVKSECRLHGVPYCEYAYRWN